MHQRTKLTYQLILILVLSFAFTNPTLAQTEEELPVVKAILFYSPTCPHCHQVIQEDLPPLIEKYGEQLLIVGINTQSIEGQELYQAMVEYFQLPDDRLGVPALVVGDTHLLGSGEIPAFFPGIIEDGLQDDGIDWPPIPGFVEVYTASVAQATAQADEAQNAEAETSADDSDQSSVTEESEEGDAQSDAPTDAVPTAEPTAISETATLAEPTEDTSLEIALPEVEAFSPEDQSMIEKFKRDPVGNSAAVVVLIGMLLSLVGVWLRLKRRVITPKDWQRWAIPLLSLVGLVVAGYLSYVEVTQSKAVCGPVGDCNTVQQSPFARLFGVLPIGLMGLMGYAAILIAWGLQYYGPERWRVSATQALWGFALFGTLFSIYLTFLEPFVIGATCAWCLSSAIVITLILWVATTSLQTQTINNK
ncbi:MAG: hypothetical protein ISR58_14855 [Anaerolineales bacterium]|nr:hypothetical protein [Chloroflexota bacterium]MBL6982456.1 hypothetical protein [Anaerolineales bacterium]